MTPNADYEGRTVSDDVMPELKSSVAHQLVILSDELERLEAAAKDAQKRYDETVRGAEVLLHAAYTNRKAVRNRYNEVLQRLTPGVRVVIGGEP